MIDKPNTNIYRHSIHKFDFTALDGKEKWTACKFTKNIYDIWRPIHFKRVCSAIDHLPADISLTTLQSLMTLQGQLQFPGGSELSQGLESHLSLQSDADSASVGKTMASQALLKTLLRTHLYLKRWGEDQPKYQKKRPIVELHYEVDK